MNINAISRIFQDESGVTAIEYGLIAALVSVAAILALSAMGESLRQLFERIATDVNTSIR